MIPISFCVSSDTGVLQRTLTDATAPRVTALLGTTLTLSITFFDSTGLAIELDPAATGRLVCRAPEALDGDTVLLDSAWDHTGGTTLYTLKTLADSEQLRALIKSTPNYCLEAQIEFSLPGEDDPRKSLPFDIIVTNGPARGDEGAADVAGATSSAWLTARAPRIDIPAALTASQRTQLLANIGNIPQQRLSDDASYVHFYDLTGIYKGSLSLLDLGQANL
jgi:hypothetical protein